MEKYLLAGLDLFRTYKEDMIDLYIEAFYQDDHSEKLKNKIADYFEGIFECGFGIVCINDHKLIAAMLMTPPDYDKIMPLEITNKIDPETSLYIAELFVDKNMRGKGYGKQLMNYLFRSTENTHNTFIIRVLTNNTPAINLYKKFLFEAKMTMLEERRDLKGNKVKREKLYLVRNNTNTNKESKHDNITHETYNKLI